MKPFFLSLFCFLSFTGNAQKKGPFASADSITISGMITSPATFSLSDLAAMPDTSFTSIKIVNHVGEYKTTYQQVKCIPLKKLFQKRFVATLKPKEMNGLYFVCKAIDGFTVVYSYNEIFNAAAGGIFLITAYDNVSITDMPERPILLITGDFKTAKMGMRGVRTIEVLQAK